VAALEQELARGVAGLRLPDSPAPYHAQVQVVRATVLSLDGSYGGIITDVVEEQAVAAVDVRVGSAARDQSGTFGSDGPMLRYVDLDRAVGGAEPQQAVAGARPGVSRGDGDVLAEAGDPGAAGR
jgi:hypothetical protein